MISFQGMSAHGSPSMSAHGSPHLPVICFYTLLSLFYNPTSCLWPLCCHQLIESIRKNFYNRFGLKVLIPMMAYLARKQLLAIVLSSFALNNEFIIHQML